METSKPGETTPASSFLAHTNGVYFAALVPLMEGANIIKVKGTDHSGVERSATVTINASPTPDPVLLTYITPNAGLPELKPDGSTSLDVIFQTVPNIEAPTGYLWDLNGDSTGELQCHSSPIATGRFTAPGLYLPTVTMTDSQGRQYKDTTIVNVMNRDDMGAMFKMIWKGMKNSLSNQDITRAMTYISDSSKNSFASQFAAVGTVLSTAVANMGDVNRVKIEEDFSEYEFKTQRNGDTYSFQVIFNRGIKGDVLKNLTNAILSITTHSCLALLALTFLISFSTSSYVA